MKVGSLVPDVVGGCSSGLTRRAKVRRWALSGRGGGDLVLVKLQKVVRRRDKPPLRACSGEAATSEAIDAAVGLDLREHRLGHPLTLGVKAAADIASQDPAHEVIGSAQPGLARAIARGVGGDDGNQATLAQAALPARLVFTMGQPLGPPILNEPALTGRQPLRAIARDLGALLLALSRQPLGCRPQPRSTALPVSEFLGQLVAARRSMDVVFDGVELLGLLEDLGGDLLIAADRAVRRIGGDLAAVDRDDSNLH